MNEISIRYLCSRLLIVASFSFFGNTIHAQTCGDLGAENGWSLWQAAEGYNLYGGIPYPTFFGFAAPTSPRFNITTGAGVDPCTIGTLGPQVPVVCPGFGNFSIQLGQPNTSGLNGGCTSSGLYPPPGLGAAGNGCSEHLKFPITVVPADTNFIYAFAIVVENPASGHTASEAPFAEIYILDQLGDTVPCSHQKYVADLAGGVGPGFYAASCAGSINPGYPPNGMIVSYRPWTYVGVNLAKYVGKNLTIHIVNSDCALGGHYCYSYWDFACPPLTGAVAPFCLGQQTTVVAPASDPANPYTYTWYQNHVLYTGPPSSTSQSITPTPAVGDTFAVHVHQTSGCDFWMPFAPQILSINANFTLTNSCGTVKFTDASTSTTAGPIVNWNWSFPGGNPATANTATATVQYPPGSYTVTLIVTSQSGCKDTFQLPVSTGNPLAAFNTGPVCLGLLTQFTDASTGGTNDPVATWDWNFGDASANSAAQNPSHLYAAAGTYSVTQIVTTQSGCKDTIVQTVTVNPPPVSLFTSNIVCFNNPTVFTDQSVGNNTVSTWAWNFGDGNTSALQSPSHTYGTSGTFTVTLIVTNNSGCKDTLSLTSIINPLPVANFNSVPVCIGNPTSFTDGSTVTPGTITAWSWNFGDPASGPANTSAAQNPTHTYNGTGPYTVILTVTSDSGCQSTKTLQATLNPLPVAAITPKNVCLNALTNFTDASTSPVGHAINTWDWNFGDGTPNSNQQNPSHTYVTAGTFTLTLIVTTVDGCKDTVNNTVTIYNHPIANFSKPDSGCAPLCVDYTDLSTSVDGNIAGWVWSFPGAATSTSGAQNPKKICYNKPGSYSVSLLVTSSFGCVDSIKLPMINVYPWPKADFCVTPNIAPATDPVFNFCDQWSQDVVNWSWNFGDNSNVDSVNTDPAHSYSATAISNDFYTYNICIRVQNQHGCWDTTCKVVELIPEFEFYIPNTFTPNSDGMNEFFFGKCRGVKDYNIWVFDRWGNELWDCHRTDKNTNWDSPGQDGLSSFCKWDGKVAGGGMDMNSHTNQLAQEDVYVWKVELVDIFNKPHTYIGHVNIVR